MQSETVVEALVCELDEVLYGDGSDRFVEGQRDDTAIFDGDLHVMKRVTRGINADVCLEGFTVGGSFFFEKTVLRASVARSAAIGGTVIGAVVLIVFFFNYANAEDHGLFFLRDSSVVVCDGGVLADLVYELNTGGDPTEGGVLTVEVVGVLVHDEELGACAVIGIRFSCHGDDAADVGVSYTKPVVLPT